MLLCGLPLRDFGEVHSPFVEFSQSPFSVGGDGFAGTASILPPRFVVPLHKGTYCMKLYPSIPAGAKNPGWQSVGLCL